MTNRPILTAKAMRHAEEAAMAAGTTVENLMARAGVGLAEAIQRLGGSTRALILCGPGNNGGDGYVAARELVQRGFAVTVAASGAPKSDAAKAAKEAWKGEVVDLADAKSAPILVDCLFGTGLSRGLDATIAEKLVTLAENAQLVVACDLPSGVEADSGAILSDIPDYDMTVALGALKPAHRLMPASSKMGRVVLADIGIEAGGESFEIGAPDLPVIAPDAHKYSRGFVQLLAGMMPGAISLSALAAFETGAGYVKIATSHPDPTLPKAIVQADAADLNDERLGCVLVGPGMGNIPQILTLALTSYRPKVIDADAIRQIGEPVRLHGQDAILTPHAGEFDALFGKSDAAKPARALAAARDSQAVIVFKGADTIVAAPDGRLGFAPPAPEWLASAGTGDVLAGIIASLRAQGMDAFEAACAGVWLHGRAAEKAGEGLIADDLITAIGWAKEEAAR